MGSMTGSKLGPVTVKEYPRDSEGLSDTSGPVNEYP